ncbi:MAG: hypothetical protein KME07_06340 [Pegethrix bostrychoides GSE-TBD4-15B]|jgi:hypothetical protein|uniref:Uncharacterized protein n=1 Tax=Pegethrix bostrychoides GSE-TBD4-15B TaxID=2839662 RepID=A0A951U3V1_9CYAN|nr:hypothetical protein [Pegethrix bostrychoides GSE-TBD4-15B]
MNLLCEFQLEVVDQFFNNIAIRFLRSLPGGAQQIHQRANLKAIRELICYNQGRLADYSFVASECHKRLKEELVRIGSSTALVSQQDLDILKNRADDLSGYLDYEFRRVSHENFERLLRFFTYKTPLGKPLRACIKAVEGSTMVTLARDKFSIVEEDFSVGANTAFTRINETGTHYICNNIPSEVKRGSYRNARIYEDAVRQIYSEPGLIRRLRYRHSATAVDRNWQQCWKRVTVANLEELPPIETCYKSTLVIPMTLLNSNNWLSSEFRSHFNIGANGSRASFGFLCLDHQNTAFFNENEDLDLGYIFADISSLYLIQRLTYTTYSRAFNEAANLVQRSGMP